MKSLLFILFLFSNSLNPVLSQSNLLESAKKNPGEAKNICNKFRELNSKGVSASENEARNLCNKFREFNSKGITASSDKAIDYVSNKKKLTPVNAEIFSIYVIGLHCPDII